jgi:NADPH:quinone reductase-like Zn-dependent oxidoreductase
MRAAVVREFGRVEVGEHPDPEPGPDEVVVELRAAALNRRDTYVVWGTQPHPLPVVPGSDGAGVRRDTGEEVVILPSLAWGEREDAPGPGFRILGGPDDGTFAELVKVPRGNVFPKPRRLSWEEAAALPLAGLTAWRALFARGRLRSDETVLVLGAGSGVSTFLVQLAATEGARVVVTSSSQEKIDRACELGAADGVLYTSPDWGAQACSLCGGGVDVVVDSVGSTWPQSLACLRPGGRVVVFGSTGGQEATLAVRPFFLNQHSLLGTTMGSPHDFEGLLRAVDLGAWKPVIDSVRPLDEANAALERIRAGEQFGKVVLTV